MKTSSKKLLLIELIISYAFLIPSLIGLLIPADPATVSPFVKFIKGDGILNVASVAVGVVSLFSFIVAFSNLHKNSKPESPLVLSLITNIGMFIWFIFFFILWVKAYSGPYSTIGEDLTGTAADLILVFLLFVIRLFVTFIPLLIAFLASYCHALTYAIVQFRKKNIEKNPTYIIGFVLLFILPTVGLILLIIGENIEKNKTVNVLESK